MTVWMNNHIESKILGIHIQNNKRLGRNNGKGVSSNPPLVSPLFLFSVDVASLMVVQGWLQWER